LPLEAQNLVAERFCDAAHFAVAPLVERNLKPGVLAGGADNLRRLGPRWTIFQGHSLEPAHRVFFSEFAF
jgi:hypothetical protein